MKIIQYNINCRVNSSILFGDIYLINISYVALFKHVEKDIMDGATTYGPNNLSRILFEHNIMTSSNVELIRCLSKHLPPENVSIILVEILANNVKNPKVFKRFLIFLGNVSFLCELYQKIKTELS